MKYCVACVIEYAVENFCSACGRELNEGQLPAALEREAGAERCKTCGRLFRRDERFCGGCGLPFGTATAGVFRFDSEDDAGEEDGPV